MKLWTMVLFAAATLLGACVGKVGDAPSGSGGSSSSGTGNNSGTGNSVSSGTGNSVVSGVGGNAGNGSVITGVAGNGVTFCDTRGVAITSQVPRLSNAQYDRVINDLLGVQTLTAANGVQPSTILATDQAGGLTELGWSSYQTVGDMVATQVIADATLKKNFMACTPTGDGKTCFHDTIIKFGRKAFRRTLTTDEIAAFDKIVSDGPTITPTGSLTEIAQTLLYAFLVSPSFLTRGEIDADRGCLGELHAVRHGGRAAPVVHALGFDPGRHAEHGGRQQPADDARADPDAGDAHADERQGAPQDRRLPPLLHPDGAEHALGPGEQGHHAVPGLQHEPGPDADGGDREVLRFGRGRQEGDVPGPVPQPDGVRDRIDGAALRPRRRRASGPTSRRRRWTRTSAPAS